MRMLKVMTRSAAASRAGSGKRAQAARTSRPAAATAISPRPRDFGPQRSMMGRIISARPDGGNDRATSLPFMRLRVTPQAEFG
jgi:hypothetical protein